MPLYEYQCKKCGHRFELIQSFSAEPAKECPVCKGEVEKLISASAILFKGSGFYSTDYGARPAKSGGSDGGPGGAAASTAAPGSTEGSSGGSSGSQEKSSPAKTESAPASTGKATSE